MEVCQTTILRLFGRIVVAHVVCHVPVQVLATDEEAVLVPDGVAIRCRAFPRVEGDKWPELLGILVVEILSVFHGELVAEDAGDVELSRCGTHNLIVKVPHQSRKVRCIDIQGFIVVVVLGAVGVESHHLRSRWTKASVCVVHIEHHRRWADALEVRVRDRPARHLGAIAGQDPMHHVLEVLETVSRFHSWVKLRVLVNAHIHDPLDLAPTHLARSRGLALLMHWDHRGHARSQVRRCGGLRGHGRGGGRSRRLLARLRAPRGGF
mmetsp:Transcript_3776/g.7749  ORF Transcript_3776/g.7749 Transcript_3776/m.7749 type:complete len:265 (-) Transcript_3776:36-830(-)